MAAPEASTRTQKAIRWILALARLNWFIASSTVVTTIVAGALITRSRLKNTIIWIWTVTPGGAFRAFNTLLTAFEFTAR